MMRNSQQNGGPWGLGKWFRSSSSGPSTPSEQAYPPPTPYYPAPHTPSYPGAIPSREGSLHEVPSQAYPTPASPMGQHPAVNVHQPQLFQAPYPPYPPYPPYTPQGAPFFPPQPPPPGDSPYVLRQPTGNSQPYFPQLSQGNQDPRCSGGPAYDQRANPTASYNLPSRPGSCHGPPVGSSFGQSGLHSSTVPFP